jgi:RimJ/RimL family protein N-acetyltransferase
VPDIAPTPDTGPDLQPTLRGSLVTLRPLAQPDWDALFAVASDPRIWEQHPARDRYQEDVFRTFFRDALACASAFAVLDAATDAIIGSTRFHGHDPVQREIEIGWTFLARSYWGGRYNGEMKRLLLQHAFTFVDQVIFVIGSRNSRSRRAIERIGAELQPSRTVRDAGSVVYAITKAAFHAPRGH